MSFEMNDLIIRNYQSGDHNSIARNLEAADMYYDEWNGEAASIYRLNVREDCRGKGIGRLLLEKADQLAKERNCPQLLFAEAENQHLEDFYEKNGFEHNSHLYKGFYKDRL